jgi:hypothetical protein
VTRAAAVLLLVLAGVLFPRTSAQAAPTSVFDAPRSTKIVKLPTSSGVKVVVTCRYYPRFMVKEVDEGEVGASQLGIVPTTKQSAVPACARKNLPEQKTIAPNDWSGYVKGVKGDFVFFDAEDGVNGAMGFAVFDVAARKLFEDSASGDFKGVTVDGETLTMGYRRSVAGECSVVKDGTSCWEKIAAAVGLSVAERPDCAGGYLQAKTEMAKGRCEADDDKSPSCVAKKLVELDRQRWDESPSVITYDVRTVIGSGHATTTAVSGAVTCHPAD